MNETRPNPEELLKKINEEELENKRGKLKIFFGYAAGVGKTYAMLDAAHAAKKAGVDVVVGYIEPHTRPETLALLDGLELLPKLEVKYKGITLKEFDLDGALQRKPELILVDELAHTNAHGLRHKKRYSDIEELLSAGIDVYTTVNVQHIESLNDIIASITHVVVKERVPDRFFNDAFQVELIDIEPSDLIDRLNAGKIYREKQAKRALNNFFTRENLAALREIALRETADRVNKEVTVNKSYSKGIYHTNEHILVCLSSSPSNTKVIRAAARMAEAFHAEFTALFVETIVSKELDEKNIKKLRENLKLAEDLGANVETVYGDDVPYQVAEFAKLSGVSKIILGRTKRRKLFFKSKLGYVDRIVELAPEIDLYVIPDSEDIVAKRKYQVKNIKLSSSDVVKTLVILALAVGISAILYKLGFSEANVITVFILGVLLISNKTDGIIYGGVASLASVLLFNFLFTDPRFSLNFYDPGYLVTFIIMLTSALVTSTLTNKVKYQANVSAVIANRTNILLEASRDLERTNNLEDIILTAQRQLYKFLKKPIIIYEVENESIKSIYNYRFEDGSEIDKKYISEDEKAVVSWVIRNKKRAGVSTDTLPGAKAMYIPLTGQNNIMVVIGIVMIENENIDSGEKSLLEAMLSQISFAIEKYILNESKKNALMQAENERFRANLLRAVSHDLRTPLTSISGSASSILNNEFDEETKKKLILDIYDDSVWLINLVENLLSVSRLDNGNVKLNTEPQLIEEIINEALEHVNRKISDYKVKVNLKDDLLMVDVDVRLIVQVMINIVDNAIKYTEPGSEIQINVFSKYRKVVVEVIDNGRGISKQNQECIFDMFFTVNGNKGDSRRGLGLGLALCKSIINAHGGEIYVRNNKPHGTVIGFTLSQVEVNNEGINFSS
ncbi:sensor histidine kinase KdpD [Clostridium sp. DSM 100503]|uniref:sensor histidine kinase n=1 Tax=Clostridium sp. DSM 100503 TaxID=2963282 RepID=UPI00214A0EEA|nr:sensor histidine kinase KdpD [Clostridium sp. DSM 100503]MCR1950563.1 sensor histidine kinase KdpD [Clostridium sp. DSM 100503]